MVHKLFSTKGPTQMQLEATRLG